MRRLSPIYISIQVAAWLGAGGLMAAGLFAAVSDTPFLPESHEIQTDAATVPDAPQEESVTRSQIEAFGAAPDIAPLVAATRVEAAAEPVLRAQQRAPLTTAFQPPKPAPTATLLDSPPAAAGTGAGAERSRTGPGDG